MEMIKIQSVSYTSLKDLLPSPMISSPTTCDHCCWSEEIPIKNPLVKHAALSYLQPMSSPTAAVEKGSFGGLKGRCCHESACVFWLYDVVWRNIKAAAAAVWEEQKTGL
ncbi:hypothetical protein V6N13_069314 [Hibiscus sabdariffa]|uniref:Uncharacterized protein n=1 Tax=Hibiscus sabdariffa TaxID=183260 RepID=A0ABR2PFZ9_9ROSI